MREAPLRPPQGARRGALRPKWHAAWPGEGRAAARPLCTAAAGVRLARSSGESWGWRQAERSAAATEQERTSSRSLRMYSSTARSSCTSACRGDSAEAMAPAAAHSDVRVRHSQAAARALQTAARKNLSAAAGRERGSERWRGGERGGETGEYAEWQGVRVLAALCRCCKGRRGRDTRGRSWQCQILVRYSVDASRAGAWHTRLSERYGRCHWLEAWDFGRWQGQSRARSRCRRSHATTLRSRPTAMKASMARSSCSRVCAAEIWVRMRALPLGTTGKLKPMA